MTEPVQVHDSGAVRTITMNRPEALNAFDEAMVEALAVAVAEAADTAAVRCLVVTGSGRAFCAGGDLRAISSASEGRLDQSLGELADRFHQAVRGLRTMGKPSLAAVNGVAAGGGFSLALACDLRVMASSAVLRQAYTSNGLCMDGGGSYHLPRLVGVAKALELAMLDPVVPAEEAKRLGLASQVFPDEEFAEGAAGLAAKLAAKPIGALARVKALVLGAHDTTLDVQLDAERDGIVAQAGGPEGQEGIAAFLEKRKPSFA
jgi:2-(1,2-epoxy-1,2-dihydrophenyl)acetyl-CoA isomerase